MSWNAKRKKDTSKPLQGIIAIILRDLAIKSGLPLSKIKQLHKEVIKSHDQGGD